MITLSQAPEPELIVHSMTGNREAIAELFRRYYPSSVRVARRILPTLDDSLDAVQSAYLAAFQNFRSFRGDATFKTWITRIVTNECLMMLRRPARWRAPVSLDDSRPDGTRLFVRDKAPTPEETARCAEVRNSILDSVAALPPRLRDVFTLCYLSGLSLREAARELGLSVPATKTRLFRARSHLQSDLRTRFCSIRVVKCSR